MNMYVPVIATLAALLMPRIGPLTRTTTKPVLAAIGIAIAGNAIAFSILGGALLTRYLLPLYPLVLLMCVAVWHSRGRVIWLLTAPTAAAFIVGLWINPPYSIAPEDNLTYADFVLLHQEAISVIAKQFPSATVLSAWPATAEMDYPDLGYTVIPIKTVSIDNFSADQLAKAAADPGAYDTALLFSTKWAPPSGALDLIHRNAPGSTGPDARYFDFHDDVRPAEAAVILHGELAWQAHIRGEWVAILRFPRIEDASATSPTR